MSKIGTLIDPEVAQKMQAVAADVKADQPAFVVRKKATDPNPPKRHAQVCKCQGCKGGSTVPMTSEEYKAKYFPQDKVTPGSLRDAPRVLTEADTIQALYDLDVESEALITVGCVDCGTGVNIDPTDPTVRAACCEKCTKIRVAYAIQDQRQIELIRRDKKTVTTINSKEQDMDIDNVPDAEVGAAIKQQMRVDKAKKIKAAKPKVEAERRKDDKKATKGRKAKQAERKVKLPGFTVDKSCEVPDLDLSDVPNLDECPSAAERRPYNQARFRLLGEPALIAPSVGEKDAATYRTLLSEHKRLSVVAVEVAKERAKKAKKAAKKTKPKVVTAAKVKADDPAKIKRAAKILGVSEKKAAKILA